MLSNQIDLFRIQLRIFRVRILKVPPNYYLSYFSKFGNYF